MKKSITKDELSHLIRSSFRTNTPVQCAREHLQFAFGFKRMDGLEIALRQLTTNRSEEDLQTLPLHETIQNVRRWAAENGFGCYYLDEQDAFCFDRYIPSKNII